MQPYAASFRRSAGALGAQENIWPAPNQSQGRALAYQVQKSVVLAICTGVSITPVVKLVQVPTKLVQALTKLVQALIKYYRPLIK